MREHFSVLMATNHESFHFNFNRIWSFSILRTFVHCCFCIRNSLCSYCLYICIHFWFCSKEKDFLSVPRCYLLMEWNSLQTLCERTVIVEYGRVNNKHTYFHMKCSCPLHVILRGQLTSWQITTNASTIEQKSKVLSLRSTFLEFHTNKNRKWSEV